MPKKKNQDKKLVTVTVKLEIESVEPRAEDPHRAVKFALDTGVFQDTVSEHGVLVDSAYVVHDDKTETPKENSPPRWEYRIVDAVGDQRNPDSLLRMLNVLGEEGWEVISVDQIPSDIRFYFKRPLT